MGGVGNGDVFFSHGATGMDATGHVSDRLDFNVLRSVFDGRLRLVGKIVC